MLTPERLREVLDYNPITGKFTWKWRDNYVGKKQTWNKRFAGKEAGRLKADPRSLTLYCIIEIDDRPHRAHRLAWLYMTGEWPDKHVDHKDLNGANNSWCNLRLADDSQNHMNMPIMSSNKSGIKGVMWDKSRRKWRAEIRAYGIKRHLGRFETIEAAAAAYAVAADRIHGEFARPDRRHPNLEMHA